MGPKMSNSEQTTLDQPAAVDPRIEGMDDSSRARGCLRDCACFGMSGAFCALRVGGVGLGDARCVLDSQAV